MISALGPFIMKHPQVKDSMEQFMLQHVLKEFKAPEPYLRSIVCVQSRLTLIDADWHGMQACEVLATVEKCGIEWSKEEVISASGVHLHPPADRILLSERQRTFPGSCDCYG